jgi:hypothetical protein
VRRVADVDVSGVAEALGDASGETAWWYDPASGRVEMGVPDWSGLDDEDDGPEERGFVPIESEGSRAAYRDMVDFAAAVGDDRAAGQLGRALEGRGAFRRFRDALADFSTLSEQWRSYERACAERRAVGWLIDSGHVDTNDGQTEAVVLADAASAVLTAIATETGVAIDESVVVERWAEVQRSIESGQTVTVVRDGRPWAIITPP